MGVKLQLIKGFLLGITGLFLVVTLLSLLIPSTVMVSRGVVVNAAPEKVYAATSNLNNWKQWHPLFSKEAVQARINVSGGRMEWLREGRQHVMQIADTSNNQVTTILKRKGENDVTNIISILPLTDSGSVQVEWRSMVKLKWYPWEKFYGIFLEKITGPGLEAALKQLKIYSETP